MIIDHVPLLARREVWMRVLDLERQEHIATRADRDGKIVEALCWPWTGGERRVWLSEPPSLPEERVVTNIPLERLTEILGHDGVEIRACATEFGVEHYWRVR